MNTLLKLEEAAILLLAIYLFNLLDCTWWWFPALLLVPDVSMLGYLLGNKAGAWAYNITHHRGTAILVYLAGLYLSSLPLQLAGILLLAHAAMDRLFGYGLKYEKGFRFTHLGTIGKPGA